MCAGENLVEPVPINFGLPSDPPKRSPIFNYHSEGHSFANERRRLIPASGFFKFTSTKYPKAKHCLTLSEMLELMCIAYFQQITRAELSPFFGKEVSRDLIV